MISEAPRRVTGVERARRVLASALDAEVDDGVASFVEEVDEDRKLLVVRSGGRWSVA